MLYKLGVGANWVCELGLQIGCVGVGCGCVNQTGDVLWLAVANYSK